jgi:hypothetical protein
MIIFDQLRISDDGKQLYINAHVNPAETFADTTIESLSICLGNQIYETNTIDPESNGNIYHKEYTEGTKEINEVISIDDESLVYNMSTFKDLLFVFIGCSGVPEGAECYTTVGNYVLGVTFDETLLYQKTMQFTKQLSVDCDVPKDFIDFILLWNAFKAAVETEHYIPAIDFWKKLFQGHYGVSKLNSNPCGCHG